MATEKAKSRPITITILSWLLIAVGVLSTAAHYWKFTTETPKVNEIVWITVFGAAAIVSGAFMLAGRNWARWLALAWMAAHVTISVFHPLQELLVHGVLLAAIAYLLFRRETRDYFSAA